MDKNFCQQIDKESLVEQYVAGKLRGDLLDKFEQHIKDCQGHAQSVLLEKALKRGVSDYARGELKTRLRDRLKKREDTRFMMLRYAAILLVAVITPLILYYQFNVAPEEMAESVAEAEKEFLSKETEIKIKKEDQKNEEERTESISRKSISIVEEEKPVLPVAPAGASRSKPESSLPIQEKEEQKIAQDQGEEEISPEDVIAESSRLQDVLRAVESTPTPKLEADHPPAGQMSSAKSKSGRAASRTTALHALPISDSSEMHKIVNQDSLAIRKCVDNFLNESERDKYKIDLNIQVLKNGEIGEINIIRTTHQSSELENCLFNLIKEWTLSPDVNDRQVLQELKY